MTGSMNTTHFSIESEGLTDVGLMRAANEDAFWIDHGRRVFVVADGMGGAAAGEIASKMFVESANLVSSSWTVEPWQPDQLIQDIFFLANQSIYQHSMKDPDCRGMGCTAEVLVIDDTRYTVGHVGDSRVYLCRDGRLTQLTRDHSWVQQQIDTGMLTEEEGRSHRLRNVILRAVGTMDQLAIDLIRGNTKTGDLFLLCSDGLTDMVTDQSIRSVLSGKESVSSKAAELVRRANSNGGRDNITVLLVEVMSDE